jgi:hypothetical protein
LLRLTKIFRLHNSPKSQSPEQGEEFIILPDGDSLTSPENSGSSFSSKHIVNHRLYLNDRSALRVEDKRMTQAGICKGDYVIVRPKTVYYDGEIVAVKLSDRILIRQYSRVGDRIRLDCAESNNQVMILDKNTPNVSLLGVVEQVIKELP